MRPALEKVAGLLLPQSTAGRVLAVGACADSIGSGMFFSVSALYFVGVVGLPASHVAYTVTAAGVFALFAPVPVGRIADRLGAAPVYMALLTLSGIGSACYALVSHFPPYLILTVILTVLDRSCSPIQQAVITEIMGGADRTRTLASVRAVRNIGLTLGFLLGGAVFAVHRPAVFMLLFVANGVSFLVIAFTVRIAVRLSPVRRESRARDAVSSSEQAGSSATEAATAAAPSTQTAAAARRVRSPFRNLWFMVFMVGNGVLSLNDTLLLVLFPIWIIEDTQVPRATVPLLLAINTVLTVCLQVYVARFAKGTAASVRLLLVAGATLAACCACFALAQESSAVLATAWTALAVVFLSIAENLQSVAAWELSAELSPQPARARYLAAFSLGLTGQKVIGPTLLVAWLLPLGIATWPVLGSAFAAAALVCRTAVRRSVARMQADVSGWDEAGQTLNGTSIRQ